MRLFRIATVVIAAVASFDQSTAFAQSTRDTRRPLQAQERAPSNDVYAGQRKLGTDPDPNVRFEMLRNQNWKY
jgi:hypothetical protein